MIPHFFAIVDAIALVLLGLSFIQTIRLRKLMGEGKDTGPVKLLLIVISINVLLAASLLIAIYQKYIGSYLNYIRTTDIAMLAIGTLLVFAVTKFHFDYKKLIDKHEPNK